MVDQRRRLGCYCGPHLGECPIVQDLCDRLADFEHRETDATAILVIAVVTAPVGRAAGAAALRQPHGLPAL